MPSNRRPVRRQGVVYGPPRKGGRYSDNGALIGRFLGLGVLVLALGVLAAGALAFVGDRPAPSATVARSAVVVASLSFLPATPLLTAAPTLAPSLIPATATPTVGPATLQPTPTAAATAQPPLVQIGEGFITFGTEADEQVRILDPRTVFTIDERIVWSAYLTRPVDSIDVVVRILKLDPLALGGERLIVEEAVTPVVRNAQIFGRRFRPDSLLEGPGTYVVRYVRGEDTLSEGSLMITG